MFQDQDRMSVRWRNARSAVVKVTAYRMLCLTRHALLRYERGGMHGGGGKMERL